jgi:hypothetical protein
MANHRASNVIFVDTSAQFDDQANICKIKHIAGGASSTVTIKADSTSGKLVYESVLDDGEVVDEINIRLKHGYYVTVSGSAKAYIYLK